MSCWKGTLEERLIRLSRYLRKWNFLVHKTIPDGYIWRAFSSIHSLITGATKDMEFRETRSFIVVIRLDHSKWQVMNNLSYRNFIGSVTLQNTRVVAGNISKSKEKPHLDNYTFCYFLQPWRLAPQMSSLYLDRNLIVHVKVNLKSSISWFKVASCCYDV